jgi:transmembrane sensor
MNEQQELIVSLLHRVVAGETLEPDQQELLDNWMKESPHHAALFRQIQDEYRLQEALAKRMATDAAPAWEGLVNRLQLPTVELAPPARVHTLHRWRWVAAAAVVMLAVGTVWWKLDQRPAPTTKVVQPAIHSDNKHTVLQLADGTAFILDSLPNGVITTLPGIEVRYQNGQLVYRADPSLPAGEQATGFHTLRTPRGRQVQVLLPDGSAVWLNAGSSLRYPPAFTGDERKVQMTGEAYFEVAKKMQAAYPAQRIPFLVSTDGKQDVEVLGTHFNINAYTDEEKLATTLLEGKVKVTATQPGISTVPPVILTPGEQAQLTTTLQVIPHIDTDKVMAWKNGFFNFEDEHLPEVMRQLQRWYAIDVVYEKGIPDITFVGKISKSTKLTDVLTILEKANVHFRLEEDGKLIVQP